MSPVCRLKRPDLAGRDVDVVGGRREAGVHVAQETEAVREDFQNAVGKDLLPGFGALLDDREHQLLLAHAAGVSISRASAA